MNRNVLLSVGFVGLYLFLRLGFDFLWRQAPPYYSYVFELCFVFSAIFIYRKKLQWKIRIKDNVFWVFLGLVLGFAVHKLAPSLGILIPFDFKSYETIFLLLVVAPILEELIFRMALWEALTVILKNTFLVLIVTSILFSLGHFLSFWSVPIEFQTFVLYQSFYVILLGFGAGWRRIKTGSVIGGILLHFGFNFGFFMASL